MNLTIQIFEVEMNLNGGMDYFSKSNLVLII